MNIINKLVNGKVCVKEIFHLTEKMGRLSPKELLNKYIISGFSVITKLVMEAKEKDKESFDETLITKIKETNLTVMEHIDNEIDNWEEFDMEVE